MKNVMIVAAIVGTALTPMIANAQSGTTSGAVGGAVGGAIVGGPVGAVVGGVGGAIVGGIADDAQPASENTWCESGAPPILIAKKSGWAWCYLKAE